MKTLRKLIYVALVAIPLITLNSCSKSNSVTPDNPGNNDPGNNDPGNSFTAADFTLTIDEYYEPGDDYPGEDYLRIDYTIKNVSSKNFPKGMSIRWKVKAADGAYYERLDENIIFNQPLNAGASIKTASVINLGTPHNNADRSTLTYTLTP
ncbi:hypothetical protein [Taibaiella chishuiensis]|uniref:DUF4352 domain-containing protein n=1 Tax=Taibaiella chishuiensis TaxID=1434707 RepID=A0A2P8CWG6_9BACT|nr:hypothetical protein [Taibaiella chishuiensis]PSK89276.1 hypothetical protein B0I18_11277 [Taibaiella chishuiensis]